MPAKKKTTVVSQIDPITPEEFLEKLICWPMKTDTTLSSLGGHGWKPESFTKEQLAFMEEKYGTPEAQWTAVPEKRNGRWWINHPDQSFRLQINRVLTDSPLSSEEANSRLNEKRGFTLHRDGKTMAVSGPEPLDHRAETSAFAHSPVSLSARSETGLSSVPESPKHVSGLVKTAVRAEEKDWSDDEGQNEGGSDTASVKSASTPATDGKSKYDIMTTLVSGLGHKFAGANQGLVSEKTTATILKEKREAELEELRKTLADTIKVDTSAVAKLFAEKASTSSAAAPVPVAASRPPLPPIPPAGSSILPPPSAGSPPLPPPPPPPVAPPAAPVSEPDAARVTRSASKASAAPAPEAASVQQSFLGRVWGGTVNLLTGAGGQKTLENQDASGSTSPGSSVVRESSGIAPLAASHILLGDDSGPVSDKSEEVMNLRQIIQEREGKMKVLEERVTQLQVERTQMMKDLYEKDGQISILELNNGMLKQGNVNADQISDLLHQANVWEKRYDEAEAGRLQWIQRYDAEVGKNSYLRDEVQMYKDSYEEERDRALKEIALLNAQLTSSSPVSQAKFNQMESELRQVKRDLEDAKRAPPSSTDTGNEIQLMMDLQTTRITVDDLTRELQASKAKVAALEQARTMPPPPPPLASTISSQGEADLQKKLAVALKERDDAMTLVRAQMDANRKLTNEIADLKRQASSAYSSAPTRAFTVSSVQSAPNRSVTTSSFVSASSSISSSMSESETARKLARMEEKYSNLHQMYEGLLRETGKRSGTTPDATIARYEAYLAAKAARSTRR